MLNIVCRQTQSAQQLNRLLISSPLINLALTSESILATLLYILPKGNIKKNFSIASYWTWLMHLTNVLGMVNRQLFFFEIRWINSWIVHGCSAFRISKTLISHRSEAHIDSPSPTQTHQCTLSPQVVLGVTRVFFLKPLIWIHVAVVSVRTYLYTLISHHTRTDKSTSTIRPETRPSWNHRKTP